MEQRAAHRASGHSVARRSKRLGSAAIAAALLGLPLIAAAPANASTSTQWPLQYLKADQSWNITKGSGQTVAVLDTGVTSIGDTQGSLLSGADFSAGSTSSGNGQTDLDGHGTGIAVLVAGSGSTYEGLAPSAKILPVRISTGTTDGPDNMADGVRYAISQHASVINLSQRANATDSNLASAIQAALAANIVVVAASGNEGNAAVDYPAAIPGVLAVGAVDQSGTIWSSSNTGSQVSLSAPGVNIPVEDNLGSTGSANGTSASTAYVSATVALIRSAHPSWTAGQVIRDLISTADPASGQTAGQHSDQYGYGIVDPLKALQASAPSDTSNPLLTSSTGASASATPAATATNGTTTASPAKSSSGLIIGIVVAIVVVVLIIILIIALSRRNKNRPGGPRAGGGSGGAGGPGNGQPYGQQQQYPPQYPQQNPYQQQNPQYPYGGQQGRPPQR